MTIDKKIGKKVYRCSIDAMDFFVENEIKQFNANVTLDLMGNCLDTIFDLVSKKYPRAIRPDLYLADTEVVNAFATVDDEIVVTSGLIFKAAELIHERYTKDKLSKYLVLENMSHEEVLSNIRVYFWRYVVLHELYHLWNGHRQWKTKYRFGNDGKILESISVDDILDSENTEEIKKGKNTADEQMNITQQALELDADGCAVFMLVNLLMRDARARNVSNIKEYVKNHMALMMAALATAFCLFDGNSGAKFEMLDRLAETTHPLPAIRLAYAEEIANGRLAWYFQDDEELFEVESEWQKIICDIEADHHGVVDMGQVFYFTAYTEKAQRHLCRLKRRFYDMYDTISVFFLANHEEKLCEDDMSFYPESVWFTENGSSIRGWVNPATGTGSAIKAKPRPIIKGVKIGRNEKCPCGSGLKFKKCTCSEYHDTNSFN